MRINSGIFSKKKRINSGILKSKIKNSRKQNNIINSPSNFVEFISMILIQGSTLQWKLEFVYGNCRKQKRKIVMCCPWSGSSAEKQKQIVEFNQKESYKKTSDLETLKILNAGSLQHIGLNYLPALSLSFLFPAMEIQFPFNFISCLFTFSFLSLIIKEWKKLKDTNQLKKLPPGPRKWPLIGHLHHIVGTSLPHHHSLRNLAQIYGPLMHLKFGEVSAIVVSSPEMAKEVLKTHDLACANRPKSVATEIMWYNYTDIVFSPYGDYWKQMRKICILEMLSPKNVRSFASIREDEAACLVESIRSTCEAQFDLTEKIFLCTSSITCRTAFGKVCRDRETSIRLIKKAIALAGHFDLADLFPSVKVFDLISWNKFKLLKMRRKLDAILDTIIDEHRKNLTATNKANGELGCEDLVDVLLRLKESGELDFPMTNDNIKAIIFDMFSAGTESSSSTLDWAMAELVKNTRVMVKAQSEIRQVFNVRETINETDIHMLKYLKLVIKETLRLHPPVSIIPRACREECEIGGYHIPLNANVIVNIWSIGRDHNYWENPESFEPERFEKKSVDFLGNHFEYLPFGSGKRICPGMTFGLANIEFLLAKLLYHFDWKLPNGIGSNDIDMTEVEGIAVSRKNNLLLIATPYDPSSGNPFQD